MTISINRRFNFVSARDAFLAELKKPAGPDTEWMLDCLTRIVVAVMFALDDDDNDFDSKCGRTGSVFTEGKSTPVPGKNWDIKQTPVTLTKADLERLEADLERLEAGWQAVEANTDADSYEMGLDFLSDLREFLADEAARLNQ